MMFETSEMRKKNSYRACEAMYRRGFDTKDIAASTGLTYTEALDNIQRIFAIDMMKKERKNRV